MDIVSRLIDSLSRNKIYTTGVVFLEIRIFNHHIWGMNRYIVYNQSIIRRIFKNLKCTFFYNTCSSTLPLFQRSKSSPSSQAIVIPPSFHLLQHRKYRKIGSIRLTIEGRESHSTFPFPRQTWLSSRAAPPDNGLSSWWAID